MKNIFDRLAIESLPPASTIDGEEVPGVNGHAHAAAEEEAQPTSAEVKQLTQELLRQGHLDESRGNLFRRLLVHERAIIAALEPLDLVLRLDTHRGVAYLVIASAVDQNSVIEDGWAHPLVRKQRLTLEQSLVVALLRQAFALHEQESGIGQSVATIAVDELLPQFLVYFGDSGSDAKNESRLLSLLDQLKVHGIVSEVDAKNEVTIRPLIAHLANPESLTALLTVLQEQQLNAVPTAKSEHE